MTKEKQTITREYKKYMQTKLLEDYSQLFQVTMYNLNGLIFQIHIKELLKNMTKSDGNKLPVVAVSNIVRKFETYGLVDIIAFHRCNVIKIKAPVYAYFKREAERKKNKETKEIKDIKDIKDIKEIEDIKISNKTTNCSHYNILKSGLIGEMLVSSWTDFNTYAEDFKTTNLAFNLKIKSFSFLKNVQALIRANTNIKELPILQKQVEILKKRHQFDADTVFKVINGKLINGGKGKKLDLGLSYAEKIDYQDFATFSAKNIFLEKIIIDEKLKAIVPRFVILNFTENWAPKKIADEMLRIWRFANETFGDMEGCFYPTIRICSLTNITNENKEKIYRYIEASQEFCSDSNFIVVSNKRLPLKTFARQIFQFTDFDANAKLLSNKLISSIL